MRVSFHTRLLLRVLSKIRVLKYLNLYPKVLLPLGRRLIKLPLIGGVGYYENFLLPHEPWLDKTIEILLSMREGAFIDVGVNLGQTLLKFIAYNDGREYYGFEPNPICFEYVEKLRKTNLLQNVKIIPVGLSDKSGLKKLLLNEDCDGAASIVSGFRLNNHYSMSKTVPVFRGDEILFEYLKIQSVGIVKIDVEGGELEVLVGLQNTIKKMRPFILCEILPVYDEISEMGKMRRKRTDQIVEIISKAGYKIVRLLHDGKAVSLETIATHANPKLCEYLFIPDEVVETVNATLF